MANSLSSNEEPDGLSYKRTLDQPDDNSELSNEDKAKGITKRDLSEIYYSDEDDDRPNTRPRLNFERDVLSSSKNSHPAEFLLDLKHQEQEIHTSYENNSGDSFPEDHKLGQHASNNDFYLASGSSSDASLEEEEQDRSSSFAIQGGTQHDKPILEQTSSIGLFSQLFQSLPASCRDNTGYSIDPSTFAHDIVPRPAIKRLHYHDYTVGWLCALPIEMAAAKMMLDEVHDPLPNPAGDHNAYQLGAIKRHNVVMTCIRSGVYGTTSATAAAIAMASTYPNSVMCPLLVGIGGGIPRPGISMFDIRLGDVVIGTPSSEYPAVVQYDYGKTVNGGVFVKKGSLNKPAPVLLNALSQFQSSAYPRYEGQAAIKSATPAQVASQQAHISKEIHETLKRFAPSDHGFSRPSPETDVLFDLECEHSFGDAVCQTCVASPINRLPRDHHHPRIHYGCIASGNQVVKHARTRDRIAASFPGSMCFEMEAAGIMDYIPCLVIRGICDYCDTHKSKEWQGFAALAAATVAKEILDVTPFNEIRSSRVDLDKKAEQRNEILKTLDFDESEARRATIKIAHPRTCSWLLQQHQLSDWARPATYQTHGGIFWLKGKPGTGKSTIMKYLVEHVEELYQDRRNVAIASFFFSARGIDLGRSIVGLYRSLLAQIFAQIPALNSILDKHNARRLTEWSVETLEDLLRQIVKHLDTNYLLCFIDALDECPEAEIRGMVDFLQQLTELANRQCLYVCFASRHYPHISIKRGYEFVLETQEGHNQDISNYLESELVFGRKSLSEELRRKVYAKSQQIFLWIVLVVQLLKREFDHGGVHNLMTIVDNVPPEVDDLFRGILTRDSLNLPQLITGIRWVLFARRPLRPVQLYHAILYTEPGSKLKPRDKMISSTDIKRFILSRSKGIMEYTVASKTTVQFIHETVREFLLQPKALAGLWPGFEGLSEGPSHEILKDSCYRYIKQVVTLTSRDRNTGSSSQGITYNYPLFTKAVVSLLFHADMAQKHDIQQASFIHEFDHDEWLKLYHAAEIDQPRRGHLQGALQSESLRDRVWITRNLKLPGSAGYLFASMNQLNLFKCWLIQATADSNWNDILSHLIRELAFDDNKSAFELLVAAYFNRKHTIDSDPKRVNMVFHIIRRATNHHDSSYRHSQEFRYRCDRMVADLYLQDRYIESELDRSLRNAAWYHNVKDLKIFLQLGARANSRDSKGDTTIHHALRTDNATYCVSVLRAYQVDLDIKNGKGQTPLHLAVMCKDHLVVEYLLKQDVLIEVIDPDGVTPLGYAERLGLHDIAQLLRDNGAYHLKWPRFSAFNSHPATPGRIRG